MKPLITLIFAIMGTISGLASGQVAVLACESKIIDIPRSAVRPTPVTEDKEIGLDVYYVGKKLGEIPFEEKRFSKLVANALAEDKSQAPFFGPGYEYIIRDAKGRHYIVFFEFKKGHKFLTGFRAAIAPLNDLGTKGAVFVGDPYAGATFDKTLLSSLKAITEKILAEQAGADQPATSPADKPEVKGQPSTPTSKDSPRQPVAGP